MPPGSQGGQSVHSYAYSFSNRKKKRRITQFSEYDLLDLILDSERATLFVLQYTSTQLQYTST